MTYMCVTYECDTDQSKVTDLVTIPRGTITTQTLSASPFTRQDASIESPQGVLVRKYCVKVVYSKYKMSMYIQSMLVGVVMIK